MSRRDDLYPPRTRGAIIQFIVFASKQALADISLDG